MQLLQRSYHMQNRDQIKQKSGMQKTPTQCPAMLDRQAKPETRISGSRRDERMRVLEECGGEIWVVQERKEGGQLVRVRLLKRFQVSVVDLFSTSLAAIPAS